MLKLPKCPYCDATYDYKDAKKMRYNKKSTCYNCKKEFNIFYKKGRNILLIVFIIIATIINVLSFNLIAHINLIANFVISLIFATIVVFLFPLTVRFKKQIKNKNKK